MDDTTVAIIFRSLTGNSKGVLKYLSIACRIKLPIKPDGDGYVDWLYLDDNLRVTRGNKGSTFVHVRA